MTPSDLSTAVPPSKIGRTLLRRRAGILALCERLRSAVGTDQGKPVADIAQRMTGKLASVSFIGQVKAGKTSLMNAFIGRPGFLPADVNPWTAVITRVTFGKEGTTPGGAVFSFFDDAEWQSFTQREGRLQKVIKAIPGSEDKIATVEAEVERMRARARFRLGDSFEALLGQAHAFRAVTPEILARYICAGDDPEGRLRSPTAGRFADITREAVINFGLDRFEHPLITVDTPGLNDPLLIREEVTLRSLEGSDIFVLVLTAHQAFSSTDLYLLRILNAMRLDRLVIFVNRVDELTDPINDLPEITRHVKEMLRREKLPEDVPVIYGSAMWAEYALGIEELVDLEQIDTFCKVFVSQDDVAEARQLFEMPDHARAWAASGLASLDRAVDHMLNSGPGRIATAKACVDLRNALQLIVMANDAELDQNRHRHAQLSGDDNGAEDVEAGPLDTEALRVTVSEMSEKLQKEMMDSLTAAWARTRFGLRRIIKDFAEEQDKQFAAYLTQTKKKEWVCDTTPLRRDLSAFFRDEHPAVKESLRRRLERGVGRIVQTLDEAGLKGAAEIQLNTVEFDDNVPVTTALSKIVSFDMEWSWWQGWLSRLQSHAKLREELANMIRSQFTPIEEELMETAGRNLVGSSKTSIRAFLTFQEQLLDAIARRSQQAARSGSNNAEEVAELVAQQEQLRETLESISGELGKFERGAI